MTFKRQKVFFFVLKAHKISINGKENRNSVHFLNFSRVFVSSDEKWHE